MARTIIPANTRRPVRLTGDLGGPALPSARDQIAALAETQETILTTPANGPARQAALAKVRALLARMKGGTDAE